MKTSRKQTTRGGELTNRWNADRTSSMGPPEFSTISRSGRALSSAFDLLVTAASPIRIDIILQLGQGPSDVSSLANAIELDPDSVSYHLRKLRDGGVVAFRCDKTRHIYELESSVDLHHEDGRVCLNIHRGPVEVTVRIDLRCAGTSPRHGRDDEHDRTRCRESRWGRSESRRTASRSDGAGCE